MAVKDCSVGQCGTMVEKSGDKEDSILQQDRPSDTGADLHITIHFTDGMKGEWSTSYKDLADKSPYFAALTNFREGKDREVEIKDVDHEGFRYILKWHDYRFKFDKASSDLSFVRQLIHTYLVADRLMLDCYQDKVIRKLKKSDLCKTITTSDLLYAADLGIPLESTLMQYLLERIGWLWSYTHMGNFERARPDPLILQGGEMAWELLNNFWLAHHHFSYQPQPKMYDDSQRCGCGTGITRLIAMQKQDGPLNRHVARVKVDYTIRKLENIDRGFRLDMSFKPFILRGGPLVWEFVQTWIARCRCHLRKVTKAARSPYIDSIFWHVCQYHTLTMGECCGSKWRPRCECLESRTTRIELGIPKINIYGTAKWVKET